MTVTQTGVPADLSEVNLADPATFVRLDMDETWRRIRAERPVWRHPKTSFGPAFWVLSRYADVVSLFSDDRFSSVPGNMLPSLLKAGGDPAAGQDTRTHRQPTAQSPADQFPQGVHAPHSRADRRPPPGANGPPDRGEDRDRRIRLRQGGRRADSHRHHLRSARLSAGRPRTAAGAEPRRAQLRRGRPDRGGRLARTQRTAVALHAVDGAAKGRSAGRPGKCHGELPRRR
ncbi:hypothetical protein M2163_000244 [Streptomyces sp. SAI-135]|nr:hypothetical protein [Streptomyces sp. SAI-135]